MHPAGRTRFDLHFRQHLFELCEARIGADPLGYRRPAGGPGEADAAVPLAGPTAADARGLAADAWRATLACEAATAAAAARRCDAVPA